MSKKIKSVCVYGIGGVGGYFGGKIAHETEKGNPAIQVYFIGRGEHLKAVQQHGLNLSTDKEKFFCFPHIATDNIRHIPAPDLYLLCVKGYDLDNAVTSISKNISADTIILPLLNGVDIYERIRTSLEMGISNTWHDNPYPAIWEKYIFITAFSLMTAYSGKTIGGVLAEDKSKSMTENIMEEVVLIGKAKNIDFKQDIVEKTLQKARAFPYETKTSFQRDYEKGNIRHEGDVFGGTLIRLAKEHDISIPTIKEVYGVLMSR
jgi:2-dehydropantoate 2-reductase